MDSKCRECGSERIAPNVAVATRADAPVEGLLGRLRASVCADCGRVTLRAENAVEVYLAARGPGAGPGADAVNIQCPSCGSVMSAAAASCEVCGWKAPPPTR